MQDMDRTQYNQFFQRQDEVQIPNMRCVHRPDIMDHVTKE
jgi:hypothetical protein